MQQQVWWDYELYAGGRGEIGTGDRQLDGLWMYKAMKIAEWWKGKSFVILLFYMPQCKRLTVGRLEWNTLNPPAELGRIVYASGDKQSTKIKPPLYNKCRSGKPHKIQRRCPMDNISLSHSRYNCTYHLVFIPKYRRKVMIGELVISFMSGWWME